jgi:glycine/D-amino acid oxidase-like deaminating enzyme
MKIGNVSFWYDSLGGVPPRRTPLAGDTSADVCIIGAGFTGLWTAYALQTLEPDLNILLIEKEFAGYGASGRNGGWLTGGFAWDPRPYGARVDDMAKALRGAVDDVIATAEREGIDADIHRTDELMVAASAPQLARMRQELAMRTAMGEPVHEIDADALAGRVRVQNALGAMVSAGVARVQPAKLVQGLAACVERRGARIVESTKVLQYGPGEVLTQRGRVKAGAVIRATEGYSAGLRQSRRDLLPLNSAQIVTEPLSPELWARIGWEGRELLGDASHVYCYCQRTADGRIAVGSRGVPYRFGSRTDTEGAPDQRSVARLVAVLRRLFPAAAEAKIDHAWSGVLGVPRDWCAAVGFEAGVGWAGGYVGVGVSTSNLAGRTLADLVLQRQTELTALPWVNHQVPPWEREPLRWLGVRGMYGLLHLADWSERRRTDPSPWARLGYWLAGR